MSADPLFQDSKFIVNPQCPKSFPGTALRNFINGEFVDAKLRQTLPVYDPSTGLEMATIPRSTEEDVELAVKAAAAAFPQWSTTSVAERADYLDKIANAIEEHLEIFAQVESKDAGKTIQQARTIDIPRAVSNFRFFSGAVRHDSTDTHMMTDAINYSYRNPIGIAGLITPWNLPLYLLSWKIAPAIAMGNTVVCKPSEITPFTASMLASVVQSVGLPPGVINIVHGLGGECGNAIVAHPKIKCLSFTGGTATGKIVATTAAPLFKKLSLELGGKNASVVFDDADLSVAIPGVVRSGFANNGQICLAGSRVFVQKSIYDKFVTEFVERVSKLRCGDPLNGEGVDVGPVSSLAHKEKIMEYIEKAKVDGTIACGGGEPNYLADELKGGYYVQPTVITGLPPSHPVSTEEIFGPVVSIHSFETEDEVVEYVNNTRYGLAGSVWTTNLKTAHRVCARVQSGLLWVNTWLYRDLRTPFGGIKDSGIGREGGKHSLEFYSEYKNVCVHVGSPFGPAVTI